MFQTFGYWQVILRMVKKKPSATGKKSTGEGVFYYSKVRGLKQHFKCYPAVQDHENL